MASTKAHLLAQTGSYNQKSKMLSKFKKGNPVTSNQIMETMEDLDAQYAQS